MQNMPDMEGMEPQLLDSVNEGMEVFDASGNKIGTVKKVRSGDEDPTNATVETVSDDQEITDDRSDLIEDLARAFGPDTRIPEELQERMRRTGYIQVDSGFLSSDRIVMREQVASVGDDRVNLNVDEDEVTKV